MAVFLALYQRYWWLYLALWVMLYLPDLYLLNDYGGLTFLSFVAEQWTTLPYLPAFYKYINTQKLPLSGIIFKVIMSK